MVWWENNKEFYHQNPTKIITVYCPVCKEELGFREEFSCTTLHCNECRTNFTYLPGVEKPYGVLDSTIKKTCDCPGCRASRGEFVEEPDNPPPKQPPDDLYY